jgi:hypothetical protein
MSGAGDGKEQPKVGVRENTVGARPITGAVRADAPDDSRMPCVPKLAVKTNPAPRPPEGKSQSGGGLDRPS